MIGRFLGCARFLLAEIPYRSRGCGKSLAVKRLDMAFSMIGARQLKSFFIGWRVSAANLTERLNFPVVHYSSDWRMAGRRGALIVLEGADRAGKSTQARRLVETLRNQGYQAEGMRFPERTTEIGRLVGSYLEKKSNIEDHTVHLLFSANRWEHVPLIKEKLKSGVTLVVDRYAFSGVAFTSSKENFSLHWCKQPDVGLPKPDLVIFLNITPEEASKRGDYGTERYETSDFQKKVQKRYAELMDDKSLNWKVVDAAQDMDDVHNAIKQLSEAIIQEARDQPIGQLWVED